MGRCLNAVCKRKERGCLVALSTLPIEQDQRFGAPGFELTNGKAWQKKFADELRVSFKEQKEWESNTEAEQVRNDQFALKPERKKGGVACCF